MYGQEILCSPAFLQIVINHVLLFVSMHWKSFMVMLYRISVSIVVIIHMAL